MHKHYKLNKIALKNLTHNNISPTDSNNEINLIIYYPQFNTLYLVICNNLLLKTNHLSMTNAVYEFKCP